MLLRAQDSVVGQTNQYAFQHRSPVRQPRVVGFLQQRNAFADRTLDRNLNCAQFDELPILYDRDESDYFSQRDLGRRKATRMTHKTGSRAHGWRHSWSWVASVEFETGGFIDLYRDGQSLEMPSNCWPHNSPVQAAVSAAQWRYSQRLNAPVTIVMLEVVQSCDDV